MGMTSKQDGNKRKTLVFLHSNGGSPAQWAGLAARIGAPSIIPVLPGHAPGAAAPPPSIPAMAESILGQLKLSGDDQLLVVGHSAGASIAIALADQAPDRVTGLLLCDAPGDLRAAPQAPMDAFLAALRSEQYRSAIGEYWNSILTGARPATRDLVLKDLAAAPPEAVIATLAALRDFAPVDALRRYKGPVINMISPINEGPFSLHTLLPDLETVKLAGVSHWLQLDAPDDVLTAIDRLRARAAVR